MRLQEKPSPAWLFPQSYDCVMSQRQGIGTRQEPLNQSLLENAAPSPNKRGAAALASAPSVRRSRETRSGIFAPAAAAAQRRSQDKCTGSHPASASICQPAIRSSTLTAVKIATP